jgi:hypothetical protein
MKKSGIIYGLAIVVVAIVNNLKDWSGYISWIWTGLIVLGAIGSLIFWFRGHEKNKIHLPSTVDLNDSHWIWGYFNTWIDFFGSDLDLKNDGKTLVFSELLAYKFKRVREALGAVYNLESKHYTPDPEVLDEINIDKFVNSALADVDKIFKYTNDLSDLNLYGDDLETMAVVNQLFNEWTMSHKNKLKRQIRIVSKDSIMHPTYGMKNFGIVTAVGKMLDDIKDTCSKELKKLNGSLNNKTYKNHILGE